MPIRRKAISTARAGAGMVRYIWLICFLSGILTGEPALAARLLRATVELNGQMVFSSGYGDDDLNGVAPASTVWAYLGHEPLWCEAGNNVATTLQGVVAIQIMHGSIIAQATVTNLNLAQTHGKWFLPADEVERTARAAGLTVNPTLVTNPVPGLEPPDFVEQHNNPAPATHPDDNSNTSDSMWLYYAAKAVDWLNPAVNLVGVCIGVWAFIRSRKCGYLVIAAYFAVVVFWLAVWPPIERTIRAHRPPDISVQLQQKINAADRAATEKVLAEEGHPEGIPYTRRIYFPIGPIVLVIGLWLVARNESHRPTGP